MEPFSSDEESALVTRLDTLSVASLEGYITSVKTSLGNGALEASWRQRIQLALGHAERALVKAQAAAALVEAEPVAAVEVPTPKPKSKSKKAAAAAETATATDDEQDAEETATD